MGKRKFKEEEGERKKLKTDDNAEEEPSSDVPASSKSAPRLNAFDVKHFRKELSGKHGQTVALTQFLQVCLNPDSEVDYMAEYLRCGGNSHEILRQVSQDSKKNLSLATPAFHIFHLIILKVQSELPHMISITEEACRYFLNNYTSTVEIMISENSGPKHRKIILKLFTSMVTLNPDLGIEILSQAPLSPKNLQYILEKPNYKEKDNVRTAFVNFMSSFLVEGHLPLVKALLEKQGLLSLVIPGLIQDEGSAVLMFLNILKKNVIENTLISKSLKLRTFSQNILHQLFKVYSWKGPPDTNYVEANEFRAEITQLLSEILIILFTSHKIGLYFMDTALGTTDNNKNPNLYKALLSLKRPWENQSERQVILDIISRCPDLHRAVVHLLEQNFEPQHSAIWLRAVEFSMDVISIMSSQNLFTRLNSLNPPQAANFVRYVTLPLPLLKFIQTSVGKSDLNISLHLMRLLARMLTSLKSYMKILRDESSQIASELTSKLDYFLPKHLPTPNSMVSLIHEVLKQDAKREVEKQEYALPRLTDPEALITLVDVLLLYSDVHPAHFETLEGTLDLKQLLQFTATLTEGRVAVLKYKIVSLWLVMDSAAVTLQNPMFKRLFQIMLDVYTSDDDDIWVEATETIYKFFVTTTVFEADEDEIHVILYTLRNCKIDAAILSDIIEYILHNHTTLSEEVRSRAANLEMADADSEANIEKLLDDLMKGSGTDDIYFLGSKVPSAFLTGCIKYAQGNKEAKKALKPFLSIYVTHLFHCNSTPELIEALIEDFKLEVRGYVASWAGPAAAPAALSDALAGRDTTIKHLSEAILCDDNVDLTRFEQYIEEATGEDKDITLFDAPYKLRPAAVDGSSLMCWAKYVCHCAAAGAPGAARAHTLHQLLHLIIEMCKKQHKMDIARAIVLSVLNNTHFLKIYSPVDLGKNDAHIFATRFLLRVIDDQRDVVDYLVKHKNALRAYQNKNYNEIVKCLDKIKKRKTVKSDHTVQVLQTIGMSQEDDHKVLNQIFDMDASHFINDSKEPTLPLEVLRALVEKYADADSDLPNDTVHKVAVLYSRQLAGAGGDLGGLERALLALLANKPYHAAQVGRDQFRSFFAASVGGGGGARRSTAELAAAALGLNAALCDVALEELGRPEILGQRELTLPLGVALLNHGPFLAAHPGLLAALYEEYKSGIFKMLEKPHKAGPTYVRCAAALCKLVLECAPPADLTRLLARAPPPGHLPLLQAAYLALCLHPDRLTKDHLVNYLLSALQVATLALKEGKDADTLEEIVSTIYTAAAVSEDLPGLELDDKDAFARLTDSAVWQAFCRAVLREALRLRGGGAGTAAGALLALLTTLARLLLPAGHAALADLFHMATSHSDFLRLMLSHGCADAKTRLVELLYHLVRLSPAVMKAAQVPVYLAAYRATTAPCDRLLLALLRLHEQRGPPLHEYRPYLWGEAAARHYAVRGRPGAAPASLWARPPPDLVLGLLDRDLLDATARRYPAERGLDDDCEPPPRVALAPPAAQPAAPPAPAPAAARDAVRDMVRDGVWEARARGGEAATRRLVLARKYRAAAVDPDATHAPAAVTYDPAFVLPLLGAWAAAGGSAYRALRGGALALPVLALSSRRAAVRAAAAHVLHRFWLMLETETRHKNDRLFLTDFVTLLRRSLRPPADVAGGEAAPARLPGPAAVHLARALGAATAPAHPLYEPVNNYLIAKQRLDLGTVPDFLALFHDAAPEAGARRDWALRVLRDGPACFADVAVVFRTMCFKMIMDYGSSALCGRRAAGRVLAAAAAAAAVPRAAPVLLRGYGLLAWLARAARPPRPAPAAAVAALVASLLRSLHINAFAKLAAAAARGGRSALDAAELRVPRELERDLLQVVQDARPEPGAADDEELLAYVETLNLFSKRTLKLMSRQVVLSVLGAAAAGGAERGAAVRVLRRAVTAGSAQLARHPAAAAAAARDPLAAELVRLVQAHLS